MGGDLGLNGLLNIYTARSKAVCSSGRQRERAAKYMKYTSPRGNFAWMTATQAGMGLGWRWTVLLRVESGVGERNYRLRLGHFHFRKSI